MKITLFSPDGARQASPDDLPGLLAAADETAPLWVDMTGPTADDLQTMQDVFKFHPLAIEDTTNEQQRPKIDDYPDYLFVILNTVAMEGGEAKLRELDVFVGRSYIVTIHTGPEPVVAQVQARVPSASGRPGLSSGYLFYSLLDTVIDGYFPVLDDIDEAIDDLENEVLAVPGRATLNRLFRLKRMLVRMARVIWPQREVVNRLLHPDLPFSARETLRYYLHDVQDHLLWIADAVSTYRDTLTSITDLYMSAVSNRLNVVVNRLTVITVLIGALTVIGGFYGMNFSQTWPPFGMAWGVPVVLGLMALIGGGLLLAFRRLNWI